MWSELAVSLLYAHTVRVVVGYKETHSIFSYIQYMYIYSLCEYSPTWLDYLPLRVRQTGSTAKLLAFVVSWFPSLIISEVLLKMAMWIARYFATPM